MDKIEELKKLLWVLDSKHNVSIPQTKENIDFIADEIVKLFCKPAVVGQSEQFYCVSSNALVYGKPCKKWCGDENCKALCKQ